MIKIRGARTHNLKNISLDLPKNKLVVITGLSGSGKSSLAFDTLYAEGQRRYVESLSAYARQFLQLMDKPDVDSIDGLSPAIAIEQKTTSNNPRSTVGTVTEIYDYFRLLFARIGVPHSPTTGLPIEAQTISQMVDKILALPEKTKVILLAPLFEGRKGEFKKEIKELTQKGFQRVRLNGEILDIDQLPELDKNKKNTLEVVVDRVVIGPSLQERLSSSVETAVGLSHGIVRIKTDETEFILSSKFSCPVSGFSLPEIEPRLFSFNSPQGACPKCDGLGVDVVFDEQMVVPDPSLSLQHGAISPWSARDKKNMINEYYEHLLTQLSDVLSFDMDMPFEKLQPSVQKLILHGGTIPGKRKPFEGVIPSLVRRWKETESDWIRTELEKFQTSKLCDSCDGHRLKPESLCVKIQSKHIGEITMLSIVDSYHWVQNLNLSQKHRDIARRILLEIENRLSFLVNVGLSYLTLSRMAGTLSGGESQRIRLASQIGSGLTGVLYVLDEPSIGLHQRDNDRLLETLNHLRDLGNTVVVVEHDEDAILAADYVVDIGPGAGVHGGEVIASGTPHDILNSPLSLTGQYLKGEKFIPIPKERRPFKKKNCIEVVGATTHNLKNISAQFPLQTLTCVTGVSGSGKSSLVIQTLFRSLARHFYKSKDKPGNHKEIKGLDLVDKVIDIDQSPIGRTPRSNPATYVGFFTAIREWYAGLPMAKARGYGPGRFSFNVKGGRCAACEGDGVIKIEMHFLPDVYVSCDQCHGKRYNRETLEIVYKNKSIADVLDMTVEDATLFFENHPSIQDKLKRLMEVGLSYMKVGQQATTLSGGEAQRIKLSKELSKRASGKTVYILDEPTTGLHFEDVRKLLEVLHQLVDQGNTVIVIEHNLDVIKTADWIIDIGPEGGEGGGNVVGSGTPEDIASIKESYTGRYLKPLLKKFEKKTYKNAS
jgi:excinuclease ABC subunit A